MSCVCPASMRPPNRPHLLLPSTFYPAETAHWTPQGVRLYTFFVYLSDVEAGGGTKFNDLGIQVTPKLGRAILWPSVKHDDFVAGDMRTHHEALPVEQGIKFAPPMPHAPPVPPATPALPAARAAPSLAIAFTDTCGRCTDMRLIFGSTCMTFAGHLGPGSVLTSGRTRMGESGEAEEAPVAVRVRLRWRPTERCIVI